MTFNQRLLTKKQAASYCGVSVGTFDQVVNVQAIELQEGRDKLRRFDIIDLNNWIEGRKYQHAQPIGIDKLLSSLGG